jgi:hypothetical protein
MAIAISGFARTAELGHLQLNLRAANLEGGQTFYQGQSIGVQVGILDKRFFGKTHVPEVQQRIEKGEVKVETLGTKDWPWYRGITIHVQRIEKIGDGKVKATPALEKLGWQQRLDSPAKGVSVTNQPLYSSLVCVFTIEPEISQTLTPGQYTIRAIWDSNQPSAPRKGIWKGKLETEPVEIAITAAQTDEDKGKLAYLNAGYYMRKKNYDAAIRQALTTEKVFPSYRDSMCYAIAAEAYQAKGDIKSALEYYKRFLRANSGANEQRWFYITQVKDRVRALEESLSKNNKER